MNRGAIREAIELAERESLAQPSNEFWLTQLSRAYLKAGEARRAYDAASRALQSAPGNAYALNARADAAFKLGHFQQAANDYRELSANPRQERRARRGLLSALSSLRQWDEILNLLSLWALPESEAGSWRTRALLGSGRSEEAEALCRRQLAHNPDDRNALWLLTKIEIEREGLEAVRKKMGRLAKIPGKAPIYKEIYASLSRQAGDLDAAAGQYTQLAEKQSDPRFLRKQAFALAKSGHEQEAIPMLEQLMRDTPTDVYLHRSYGAACRRAGLSERAADFYRELISRRPDQKNLYGWLKLVQKEKDA